MISELAGKQYTSKLHIPVMTVLYTGTASKFLECFPLLIQSKYGEHAHMTVAIILIVETES